MKHSNPFSNRPLIRIPAFSMACVVLAGWVAGLAAAPIPVAKLQRTTPVDFEKEILPVFRANCLACHNKTKDKAGLVLETPADILKGSDNGDVVVPKQPDKSYLMKVASHQEEDSVMPPPDNKSGAKDLTSEELGLLSQWILEGATGEVLGALPIQWQSLSGNREPIYAVAVTDDGRSVASGRGNQLLVHSLVGSNQDVRLIDSSLPQDIVGRQGGAAHLDMVHSVAFSPDGTRLASAGFRVIKLWHRPGFETVWEKPSGVPGEVAATSADGAWLAMAGGKDIAVAVAESGEMKVKLQASVKPVALAFTADSKRLAGMASSGEVSIWNVKDGAAELNFKAGDKATAIAFAGPDRVAVGNLQGEVHLWQLPSVELAAKRPGFEAALASARKAVDQLKMQIATGEKTTKDAEAKLKKATAKREKAEKALADLKAEAGKEKKDGEKKDGENPEAESADKEKAAAKLADAEKQLASARKEEAAATNALNAAKKAGKEAKAKLEPAEAAVTKAAADLKTARARTVGNWKAHEGVVSHLLAHPKEVAQVFTAGQDGWLRLWDVASGKRLRQWNQGSAVTAVAVSRDGGRVAVAGSNHVIRQWPANDEKNFKEYQGDLRSERAVQLAGWKVAVAKEIEADRKRGLADAEKRLKAEEENVKKAVAAHEPKDKALKEKQAAQKAASGAGAAAEKALKDLQAALAAAEKRRKDGQAKVEQSKAAASGAARELAQAEAGLAVLKKAENPDPAMIKAAEAEVKKAQAAVDKSVEALATAAQELGGLLPEVEKITAGSKEKVEAATKKKDEAAKALAAANEALKKAAEEEAQAESELKLARSNAKRVEGEVKQAQEKLAQSAKELELANKSADEAAAAAKAAAKTIGALAFSPGGNLLAAGDAGGDIRWWDIETGRALGAGDGAKGPLAAMAFAGGSHVVAGDGAGSLRRLNLDPAWKLERRLGTGDKDSPIRDRVLSLAFSHDGKWLASGGGDPSREGEVIFWNLATGKPEKILRDVHSDTVLDLEFSFDDRFLASASADRFAKILEAPSGNVVSAFEGHTHHVMGVSWRWSGLTLVTAGADTAIKVWDIASGSRKKSIDNYSKEVTSVTYSGPGGAFLSSSGDRSVRLVDENGKTLRSFGGAEDFVHNAAITPDGKIVVAGGEKGILRVWNGKDGKLLKTIGKDDVKVAGKVAK